MTKALITATAILGATLSATISARTASHVAPTLAARCSLAPGPTMAVMRVVRDTTLPFGGAQPAALMSSSSAARAGQDSPLSGTSTVVPAARVKLLEVDSATRARFAAEGITDRQPVVYLRAYAYGADCREVPWTSTQPFMVAGDEGYVRASVLPRAEWVGNTPVLIIPSTSAGSYPYPRQRPYGVSDTATLAPALAMFQLELLLERQLVSAPRPAAVRDSVERLRRGRVSAWARANLAVAELEPIRSMVRRALLDDDWNVARNTPSRLRGTYRVQLQSNGATHTWYFRTQPTPSYAWNGPGRPATTAALLASPYVSGYQLVGSAAESLAALRTEEVRGATRAPLVWLGSLDRPTAPDNEARRELTASLEFMLGASPESSWDALQPFVPPLATADSLSLYTMLARMGRTRQRNELQPRIPLTLRLDARGGVRAESTFVRAGQSLRVVLMRIDTLTMRRTF